MTGPSVWPSIRVAVQRLGVQHELPALGRGGGYGNRCLAADKACEPCLCRCTPPRVRARINLGFPLTLLLVAHPMGQIEQRTKAILEPGITLDLTAKFRMTRPSRARRKANCGDH